jgi:hypothetical protein
MVTSPCLLSKALQYGFWIWREESTHSFVHIVQDKERATYFCLNVPEDMQSHIFQDVGAAPSATSRMHLFLDMIIVDHVLASYRKAIASYRDKLLEIERNTKSLDNTDHEAGATQLHDLSILWHTIHKDLSDITGHIQHLRSTISSDKKGGATQSTHESLRSLEDLCLFWQGWVETYKERTSIRINLVR